MPSIGSSCRGVETNAFLPKVSVTKYYVVVITRPTEEHSDGGNLLYVDDNHRRASAIRRMFNMRDHDTAI